MADTTKHGKKGKGHRMNLKKMTKGVVKVIKEGENRQGGVIRVTVEGHRDDLEKVTWTFRSNPRTWM